MGPENPRLLQQFLEQPKEALGFDPRIESLVFALNTLAPRSTYTSCEGHLDGERYPYPWVSLDSWTSHAWLQVILERFNEQNSIAWEVSQAGLLRPSAETLDSVGFTTELEEHIRLVKSPILPKSLNRTTLGLMQESAHQLATEIVASAIDVRDIQGRGSTEAMFQDTLSIGTNL